MNKTWLPVIGHEGFYEVSDCGDVRTVARRVNTKGGSTRSVQSRLRKPVLLNGYPAVNLSMLGRTRLRTIHVMMAEAFLGPRPSPLHDCCHWDDSRTNNFIANLRWATKVENSKDAIRNGRKAHGEKMHFSKVTGQQALAIYLDRRPRRLVAEQYSVSLSLIKRIKTGATWVRFTGHQKPPVAPLGALPARD